MIWFISFSGRIVNYLALEKPLQTVFEPYIRHSTYLENRSLSYPASIGDTVHYL